MLTEKQCLNNSNNSSKYEAFLGLDGSNCVFWLHNLQDFNIVNTNNKVTSIATYFLRNQTHQVNRTGQSQIQ